MNFKVHVLGAKHLPFNSVTNTCNPYCGVFQNSLHKTQIGITNVMFQENSPIWNAQFEAHGIRGLTIKFEIYDMVDQQRSILLGRAEFDPFINEQGKICIVRVDPNYAEITLPEGWKPSLEVMLERINTKVAISPLSQKPLPLNGVIYANLVMNPPYTTSNPIKHSGAGCPLDIGFIAFSSLGQANTVCFNADTHLSKGVHHSSPDLTLCYDSYGPTIRIDVEKLIGGVNPSVVGVFTVCSNDPSQLLSLYKWIAIDVYISEEKYSTSNLLPQFHSRFQPNVGTGSIATAMSLAITPQGIVLTPLQWFAPNLNMQFAPLNPLEVLPELAVLCGLPAGFAPRRSSCVPFIPSSLNRIMSVCGFSQLMPIRISAGWDGASDLDIACIVLSNTFNLVSIVFYNNICDLGDSIRHSGDVRNGAVNQGEDESINIDISKLPPQAHFLCFVVTSFNHVPVNNFRDSRIKMYAGESEIFRFSTKKGFPSTGLFFGTIYRSGPTEWSVYPLSNYIDAPTPVKIQPYVTEIMKATFSSK